MNIRATASFLITDICGAYPRPNKMYRAQLKRALVSALKKHKQIEWMRKHSTFDTEDCCLFQMGPDD